jgi:hypothetical protein
VEVDDGDGLKKVGDKIEKIHVESLVLRELLVFIR